MDAAAVTHGTLRQYCSSETDNKFSQKQFCFSRADLNPRFPWQKQHSTGKRLSYLAPVSMHHTEAHKETGVSVTGTFNVCIRQRRRVLERQLIREEAG